MEKDLKEAVRDENLIKRNRQRLKNMVFSIIKYILLLIFSVVYLLIFSLWTTPLYKGWYGCDASFFTMAGRGITKGWVPYVDFFDLKGPYFFFLQALGQLLAKGRTGAFILQCIALFATLVIILKLLDKFSRYISCKKKIFIISVFLFFHIATLWGGNTLEELMLPLSLLCIYLVVPTLKSPSDVYTKEISPHGTTSGTASAPYTADADVSNINEADFAHQVDITKSIAPLPGFITGLSFGIMMFAKITVAAPIAGLVIAVMITCIYKKEYKKLILFLVYSIVGILTAAAPLFIYFGLHNAIYRMLYCVFIFAFKRSVDFGQKFNLRWELKISGCYFAIIFVIFQVFPVQKIKNKIYKLRNLNISAKNTTADAAYASGVSDNANIPGKPDNNQSADNRNMLNPPAKLLLLSTLCMAVITAVFLHFGDPFIYYFTTVYPTLITAFIAMFIIYEPFELFKNIRLDIPIVCFLLTLCYFASHSASTLNTVIYDRDNGYYMNYVNQAKEMASLIPVHDRNDVYSFNMDMQWFEINELLPCYTYTINLQFFVSLDNRIEQDIIEMLNTKPPKWIVIGGDLSAYLPSINDVVIMKYSDIYDNDFGSLYLLNEEPAD